MDSKRTPTPAPRDRCRSEQLPGLHLECVPERREDTERGVGPASLHVLQVAKGDSGSLGKLLLRPAKARPVAPDVRAQGCLQSLGSRVAHDATVRGIDRLDYELYCVHTVQPTVACSGGRMASKRQKVHGIIHLASASAGLVGAGLAQIPGSDWPVLVVIQNAMIIALGREHGVQLTKQAAADLLLTFTASVGGRALSQFLIGWIPGLGNAVNASTAAGITEAIGWAANAYFAKADGEK